MPSRKLPSQKILLQACVALAGCVPVGAGLFGAWQGVAFMEGPVQNLPLDSHFRYLSGLLLAIGLGFWSAIPNIERKTTLVTVLTFVVVVGGLARLAGVFAAGAAPASVVFALVMELAVTPGLYGWRAHLFPTRVTAIRD